MENIVIEKVQEWHDDMYRVNDLIFIPKSSGNVLFRKVQEWIENGGIVSPLITQAEIDAAAIEQENISAKADLERIDLESIRAIREYIAAQPNAPQFLIDKENAAQAARARIK